MAVEGLKIRRVSGHRHSGEEENLRIESWDI